jgi:hypothetical protein
LVVTRDDGRAWCPARPFASLRSVTLMLPPPPRCDCRVASVGVRPIRAFLALLIVLSPQAALACGAMVSEEGQAEVTGFEALLRWDGSQEDLLVSVAYASSEPEFAWLMPLPSAPEVEEGDAALIEEAFAITEPPVAEEDDEGDGAGAPPMVGGAPGVNVIGRDTIGGLRFVTLGSKSASEVTRWMRKHQFGFHDRQEPVLQGYLDRGWVVVAARAAPGQQPAGALVPVRFRFGSDEPVYPLAMAGSTHSDLYLGMKLFVLTPYRPTSTTYPEITVLQSPNLAPPLPGRELQLRYSAPLGPDASRLEATPDTWLTRYEATILVGDLTEDLILIEAAEQTPVDYSDLGDDDGILFWVTRIGVVFAAVVLAIWISLGMARRRRSSEAPRMPGSGPTV